MYVCMYVCMYAVLGARGRGVVRVFWFLLQKMGLGFGVEGLGFGV
jgi:hypothetical protein